MPENYAINFKSIHHDCPAYVKFINRTNFPVDIAWVNYSGNLIRYRTKLDPGGHHFQNTYTTHPWVAWNSNTQDKLIVGGQLVYEPTPWRGEDHRTVIYIDRPVQSLLKLCVQKIRSLVGVDEVEDLEIPKELFQKLKKRQRVQFQDCHIQQRR